MQKIEHIHEYQRIVGRLIGRSSPQRDRDYWEGARDMLTWVMEPEREFFDPRLDCVRKIDDLKIWRKPTPPEEVHE